MVEVVGKRLNYSTKQIDKNLVWEAEGEVKYAFYVLASALIALPLPTLADDVTIKTITPDKKPTPQPGTVGRM